MENGTKNGTRNRSVQGWDSAIGAADVKTLAAVVFALGGLSWGAYSMFSGSGREEPATQRVVATALDDDLNAVEPEYTKANSDRQIESVEADINQAVLDQASTAINAIEGVRGSPIGVSDAAINAFIPLLTGDHDSFLDAIAAMGGQVDGDLDGEHPMFTHLTKVFEHAKVDVSRISVSKYEQPAGGMRMMERRVPLDQVPEGAGEEGIPFNQNIQTSVMEMRPASLFPDAPGKDDASAIEVKIPVQPKGEKEESVFSIVLTWNPEAKLWQPATYRVIKNRLMEDD